MRAWFCWLLAACSSSASVDDRADAPPASGNQLSVNDVSILFPLPANESERARFLWLVPRAGEQGPFFALDDTLPDLNGDVPRQLGYPAAMITSLRFDPCFPPQCQMQLRLVAQPVLPGPSSTSMLDDAAAHLFYALDANEAAQVVAALRAIRATSPVSTDGALRVHPGLAADIGGPTGAAVRALVVEHCRADNFIRITTNAFAFDNWGFTRFDRIGGALVRQDLVGLEEPAQTQAWLRQAQRDSLDDPSGTVTPAADDGFEYLLSRTSFANGAPVDAARARDAAARVLAIENPKLTDPESVDCASCHLATQARLFAARNGVAFDADTKYGPPAGSDASLVLDPALGGNLGATLAFGWHTNGLERRSMPSISQRTINESIEVASALSKEASAFRLVGSASARGSSTTSIVNENAPVGR